MYKARIYLFMLVNIMYESCGWMLYTKKMAELKVLRKSQYK